VARVDPYHLTACRFGFVDQERTQVGKRPGVQSAALDCAALPDPGPYIGQVLDDERRARRDRLHNPLAEHMVAIPPKPCRLAAQSTQTPLGLDGAFGLELTTQPECALLDGPPTPRALKGVVGHDRRPIESEVYSNNFA